MNKWKKENATSLLLNINWYFVNYHKDKSLSDISVHVGPDSLKEAEKTVLHFCNSEAV